MADSIDILNFILCFFADCLRPEGIDLRQPDRVLQLLPESCAITDCKSLYDTLTKERVMLLDRRLSLEATIMRQTLHQTSVNWVKSEQMLAGCLTKRLPGSYPRRVLTDGI